MAYEQGYVGDPRGREVAIEARQGGNGSSSPYSPYIPAPYSPYIKSEAQIKQDIIRARQKQLYGTPFTQGEIPAPTTNPSVNPSLRSIVNMIRTGNTPIGQFQLASDALGSYLNYQSPSFMNAGPVNAGLIGSLGRNRGFLGIRGTW